MSADGPYKCVSCNGREFRSREELEKHNQEQHRYERSLNYLLILVTRFLPILSFVFSSTKIATVNGLALRP